MLFPNRPPAPEIRPGMGYAPGARSLGYVAHMGYTPGAVLGYAPGARTLGYFSASMAMAASNAGISQPDLQLLDSLGATDQDLQDLISQNISLSELYAEYGVTIPSASTATANTTPTPTPTVTHASAGQVPSGSTLLYTASFNPVSAFITAASVIADIAAQLPANGMSMISSAVQNSGLTSTGDFTMTVLDSVGHDLVSNAQSVLDHYLNQFTNNGKISSTVTVVSAGTTASGTPQAAVTNPLTWLENNALYIAMGVGALVLVNNFTGKRR